MSGLNRLPGTPGRRFVRPGTLACGSGGTVGRPDARVARMGGLGGMVAVVAGGASGGGAATEDRMAPQAGAVIVANVEPERVGPVAEKVGGLAVARDAD